MNADLSFFSLIVHASPLVQLVMALLLGLSIVSWTIIFRKHNFMKRARAKAEDFERRFWVSGDLSQLYNQVSSPGKEIDGLESIFQSGFKEFARLKAQSNLDSNSVLVGAQRAMRIALARETDRLERNLPFLATVGSTSPYIGLFGTVWGIMNSFRALGGAQHATLGMVAPGISEALIATAMGLFAAIPAVIGYNRYNSDVERLLNQYDTFLEEFSGILHRQAHV